MQRDADSQGMSYVDNSKRVLEEAFQTGTAALQNMSGQRERLKVLRHCYRCALLIVSMFIQCMLLQAAKTKALDVINSLGLSDSLLRVIERRQKMDKYITYGGMVRVIYSDSVCSCALLNLASWCAGCHSCFAACALAVAAVSLTRPAKSFHWAAHIWPQQKDVIPYLRPCSCLQYFNRGAEVSACEYNHCWRSS